jgi:Adenylate cyclase, family 3 (some proteins contain HAMP domain)
MNYELKEKIKKEVNSALDNAENIWKKVEKEFLVEKAIRNFSAEAVTVPTKIPGYPFISSGKPEVANFIAFILDIRKSTDHLLTAISSAKASQLERVLYETTAINTAGALVIGNYNGGLTEYLGDGFLALFKVEDEKSPSEVYDAHNAAQDCINSALDIVNDTIKDRYSLPKLAIGIGLAYSKAIVTIVGIENNLHPKAIGECVYRASKLSGGHNEINVDLKLKNLWPSSKDGKIRFNLYRKIYDVEGYLLEKKD